jgi:hypothetical protein
MCLMIPSSHLAPDILVPSPSYCQSFEKYSEMATAMKRTNPAPPAAIVEGSQNWHPFFLIEQPNLP